jgi:hypothetical protein
MMLLTGCAELQVIGSTAMKEMNSDVLSVEIAAYQPKQVVVPEAKPPVSKKKTYLAEADLNPFMKQPPKFDKIASVQQKGLWESR